jgi:hypothetical protein
MGMAAQRTSYPVLRVNSETLQQIRDNPGEDVWFGRLLDAAIDQCGIGPRVLPPPAREDAWHWVEEVDGMAVPTEPPAWLQQYGLSGAQLREAIYRLVEDGVLTIDVCDSPEGAEVRIMATERCPRGGVDLIAAARAVLN